MCVVGFQSPMHIAQHFCVSGLLPLLCSVPVLLMCHSLELGARGRAQ